MNVKELKAFRAKLVEARKLCRQNHFDQFINTVCRYVFFAGEIAGTNGRNVVPNDVWDW